MAFKKKKVNWKSTMMNKPSWSKVATVSTVKRMVDRNSETLHQPQNLAAAAIGATPIFTNIAPVQQGNNNNDRSGNKINAKYFRLNGFLQAKGAVGDIARVMIIKDTENIGTAPTESDVFGGSARMLNGYPVDVGTSAYQRFKVLYDKWFTFDTSQMYKPIKINKKLNYPIQFTGNASTDEGKNTTYIVMVSNDDTDKMECACRMTFDFKDE